MCNQECRKLKNLATAYVLVLCESGSEFNTLKKLLLIPEVVEARVTFGLYDIVCKIEASSMETVKDIIINDIRGIRQVKETQTLLLF